MAVPLLNIEQALERAQIDLYIAHFGKDHEAGPDVDLKTNEFRRLCVDMGAAYLMLVERLQVERQWEADEMKRIMGQHHA